MEYEYLEESLKDNEGNTSADANFIRSVWTDKHEQLLSFADECLDYLWDIVETERGTVIILMDSGLYEERYDETTIKRISDNCEYLKFNSIDELEAWLTDKNI
jgi:hypothetical protein